MFNDIETDPEASDPASERVYLPHGERCGCRHCDPDAYNDRSELMVERPTVRW